MPEPQSVPLQTAVVEAVEFCVQRHKTVDGMAVMLLASYIQAALPRSTHGERIAVLGVAFDGFAAAVRPGT